ncbi:MAG: hypothetical protein EHM55_22695 [Acidobacteria bacterium]|nr:MAG: hypothetical protein EHM55_22695 [Acidobacteriota bacterium]
MTPLRHAALQELALKVLAQRTGSATEVGAVAAAARQAYDDLAHVSSPLIGHVGVDALTARALHLARQQYSWLGDADEPEPANEPFAQALARLARQDPAVAIEGAAAVFAMLTGLLVTFIGEPLTAVLMRKAWPDVFSDVCKEEM